VDRWNGGGFLLSPTLALTAHHVLADVSRVRVVFDHEVVNARVGRVDRTSDLALLELDEPVDGHVFDLAASSLMTGAQVGVIGFPLDDSKTLTVGTVSGLDREVTTVSGSYTQMLQTDTAINPGSSGGPVLDLHGRIVGVADAVRTDAQGIGFAVPASAVRRLLGSQAPAERMQSCRARSGDERLSPDGAQPVLGRLRVGGCDDPHRRVEPVGVAGERQPQV
jgi:S1-C subfamily serine protease